MKKQMLLETKVVQTEEQVCRGQLFLSFLLVSMNRSVV